MMLILQVADEYIPTHIRPRDQGKNLRKQWRGKWLIWWNRFYLVSRSVFWTLMCVSHIITDFAQIGNITLFGWGYLRSGLTLSVYSKRKLPSSEKTTCKNIWFVKNTFLLWEYVERSIKTENAFKFINHPLKCHCSLHAF